MVRGLGISTTAALAIAIVAASCSSVGRDQLATEIYAVKDILSWVQTPNRQGQVPSPAAPTTESLAENIRQATDSAYWRQAGVALCCEESGNLLVTASPAMQARVKTVLDDMRRFAAPAGR